MKEMQQTLEQTGYSPAALGIYRISLLSKHDMNSPELSTGPMRSRDLAIVRVLVHDI